MAYNKADQLIHWPGMYWYTYGSDGSLREIRSEQGSLIASYTYGPDGLLSSATYAGRTSAFTWDALGNRVGMQMRGGSYAFVYDPTAAIPAVIEEVTPTGTVRYFRTPDGALIARNKGSEWRFYHYDELGSTRLLTDGSGSVTDRYAYDAYGSVTSHIGSTTDNPYQYVGALGYYTHYQDPDFGLLELGFRFYDPGIGRFTQLDPVGYGINWYAYAGGNPLAWVDPWGLIHVVFSGEHLKIYSDSGQLLYITDAFSGWIGLGAGDVANPIGPMPPGEYRIHLDAAQQWTNWNIPNFLVYWTGLWHGAASEHDSWGNVRIPIVPVGRLRGQYPTRSFRFWLHGGRSIGSHGCLDVGPNDMTIYKILLIYTPDTVIGTHPGGVRLTIDYSGWKGTVPRRTGADPTVPWDDWYSQHCPHH